MTMLSTKNIKTGGGPTKNLLPGNQQCKINGIELKDESKFKVGAYHLILHMEGPDLGPTFEGFFFNKDQPELGRHKGATAKVRAAEWAFVDGTTKGGVEVSRDADILKFIKTLCIALDTVEWLDTQDDKHPTIESFITAFNTDQPFKDKFLNYCLGAREYKSKQGGYTNYDLFIPKFSRSGIPFESLTAKPSKLAKYSDAEHLRKLKITDIQDFGNSNSEISDNNTDFSL